MNSQNSQNTPSETSEINTNFQNSNKNRNPIIISNINSSAIAVGQDASASINYNEELQNKLDLVMADLLDELKDHLNRTELENYNKVAEMFKQQIMTKDRPNPSLIKKLLASLAFLDTTNGSLDLVTRVWPYIQSLLEVANEVPQ